MEVRNTVKTAGTIGSVACALLFGAVQSTAGAAPSPSTPSGPPLEVCSGVLSVQVASNAACELTGAVLDAGSGISVVIPAIGDSVYVDSFLEQGNFDEVEIARTSRRGIDIRRGADVQAAAAAAGADTGCVDPTSAYTFSAAAAKWTTAPKWYYNGTGGPAGSLAAIQRAFNNINTLNDNCGYGPALPVTVRSVYQGTTIKTPNVAEAGCGARDGVNVVGWGSLPAGVLGRTCWWSTGASLVETDQRYNPTYTWWLNSSFAGCAGRYDLEAVATHETGHSYGMGHVPEATYPWQTMSTKANGTCQGSERTLGRGDYTGLDTKY